MKNTRHAEILQLIREQAVHNQMELVQLLNQRGYDVTQATVSRDLRQLNLVKVADADGQYRYATLAKGGSQGDRFYNLFVESAHTVDWAGNMAVIKCYTGMANAVCELFDNINWKGALGTLAGDNTFMVLMDSPETAEALCTKLRSYLEAQTQAQ